MPSICVQDIYAHYHLCAPTDVIKIKWMLPIHPFVFCLSLLFTSVRVLKSILAVAGPEARAHHRSVVRLTVTLRGKLDLTSQGWDGGGKLRGTS